MGTAPPKDRPLVEGDVDANASMDPGPPLFSLCGFVVPSFIPSFTIKLPTINFPPPLPDFGFSLSIGLNCSLDNPVDVAASTPWGGGRKALSDPDPDDVYEAA